MRPLTASARPDPTYRDKDPRPCRRCGVRYQFNRRRETRLPELCQDCRMADPWYVEQVRSEK